MSEKLRTDKGNPTEYARAKYGMRGGKFPVFDCKSAKSAIKLRGHHENPNAVLRHVADWLRSHNCPEAEKMLKAARKED